MKNCADAVQRREPILHFLFIIFYSLSIILYSLFKIIYHAHYRPYRLPRIHWWYRFVGQFFFQKGYVGR